MAKTTADDFPRGPKYYFTRVFHKAAELIDTKRAEGEQAYWMARNIIDQEERNDEPQLCFPGN